MNESMEQPKARLEIISLAAKYEEIARLREELTLHKVRVDDLSEQWGITQQALQQAHAERDALAAALRPFSEQSIQETLRCHLGLVSMENCGRCGPILRAREALTRMGETEETA